MTRRVLARSLRPGMLVGSLEDHRVVVSAVVVGRVVKLRLEGLDCDLTLLAGSRVGIVQ